jgi:YYY domain-containing protein
MIGNFLLWYLAISFLGALVLPLVYRLVPGLPDRGYSFARAAGWLLWGFAFWLLTSFGLTRNNIGGLIVAFVLTASLSALALRSGGLRELIQWIKTQKQFILSAEVVFLAAFAIWTYARAINPQIDGTEKPMELAFLNAILKSPSFPPHDPWLSGYAISYYYFGYILVAMLTKLTGIGTGVAFNLAVALIFGLTALGAYGLVYNLIQVWRRGSPQISEAGIYALPVLGPVFLLIVSNVEGFLELLHARGIFWSLAADGTMRSPFWEWLGILELSEPPAQPFSWVPSRPGGVLWWRASRVLADYDFRGGFREVIDEFPFFSFLLSDMHPHVLAMPFALVAIGIALHIYLMDREDGFNIGRLHIPLPLPLFLFSAVVLGGLSFLNTWDFPIYVAIVSGAYALRRYRSLGWSGQRIGEFVRLGLALGLSGVILYLPFYVGFASQAGGILPSLIYFTRGTQFWVMFGTLLIPLTIYLMVLLTRRKGFSTLLTAFKWSAIIVGGLWLFSYLFGILIVNIPPARVPFLNNQGVGEEGIGPLLFEATLNRLSAPGAWLCLIGLLTLTLAILMRPELPESSAAATAAAGEASGEAFDETTENPVRLSANDFAVFLVLIGLALVLVPEFFYLRDLFGGRMNTIFKFYFQTWIFWGLAAAFGSIVLLKTLSRSRVILAPLVLAAILVGLCYPAVMFEARAGDLSLDRESSLDGTAYLDRIYPDDMQAVRWLSQAPPGTVAEAVGGQYSSYGRVSALSGQPAVLGWPGHEDQWRGGREEMGTREQDIPILYNTRSWDEARRIIAQYGIKYIFVGDLERSTYRVDDEKFDRNLPRVFESGATRVYAVTETMAGQDAVTVAEE